MGGPHPTLTALGPWPVYHRNTATATTTSITAHIIQWTDGKMDEELATLTQLVLL